MADREQCVPLVDDGRMNATYRIAIGVLLIHAGLWFDGEGMPGAVAHVWGFPYFGVGVSLLILGAIQVVQRIRELSRGRGERP
ncbi:hypothetical protein ACGFIW_02010 [Micromonospora sp. NPDC048935]|uniref:hypothetical protein n=1 Tax=Micromonospora sp. NPDC048935 TaxID=3364262 RepID=UPI00371AACD9